MGHCKRWPATPCCVRLGQEAGQAREAEGAAGQEERAELQAQATLLEVEMAHLKAGSRSCLEAVRIFRPAVAWHAKLGGHGTRASTVCTAQGALMMAAYPCLQAAALTERRASKRMSVMPGNSRRSSTAQRDMLGGARFRVRLADTGPCRTYMVQDQIL